ncbi:MAG: tripartite tricarboxylate transporter substrate binding protein [Burkholderiales bacterium]|nr:tripartite tricarboxylate transporter substrate binding protein [Burkholderiales bacterium]MDP2399414.1 tripartite tricarboxylate transporter substrate binding protein [Burkholderiales bacterium]
MNVLLSSRRLFMAVFAAMISGFLPVQAAEDPAKYPSKPIRFIVPFPPGGGNDTIARLVGQQMAASLGQQVPIDNRPGAAGALGAQLAANSPADGYTIFLAGVGSHGLNPNLAKKPLYDPVKDFDAISLIASAPLLVVVHPSLPVKSVKELIALAKAKPGVINYASNGTGGSSHMAIELFDMMAGTRMTHIPYKGLAPALTELMAGEVQVMFSSAVAMLPQIKAGRLRAIAMTGNTRSPAIPDIPTVAEAGLKGYETGSWYGVVAPAGTPKYAIDRLSAEVIRITKSPQVNDRLVSEAVIPVGSTPSEFSAYIKSEIARWGKVIKQAKIQPT